MPLKRCELKLLLSRRQAAALLGIDRGETLGALIANHQLRVVTVNGRLRIPRAEVERLALEGFDTAAPTRRRTRIAAAHKFGKLQMPKLKAA